MPSDSEPSRRSGQATAPILARFEWTTNESVCAAIVEAVADATGASPTDLPPLYATVDTDALDVLVSDRPTSATEGQVALTFPYDGYRVEVSSTGEGRVFDSDIGTAA